MKVSVVERPRRARARARAQAHQRLGTFSKRAVQRTEHGNHPSKLEPDDKFSKQASLYAPGSPSPRPRDEGAAAGAVTRGDIRLPQRSEDRRKGGLTTYQYDLFGNLLRVDLPDGRAIEYDVDGAGRRVARRELDAEGVEISFRGWIYRDLLRPIAEVDANGDVVARYVYEDGEGAAQNGVGQLASRLGASRERALAVSGSNVPSQIQILDGAGGAVRSLALLSNQVGSVHLVVDAETGETVQRVSYDEFGRAVGSTNWLLQPFGVARGIFDTATGLVRFGGRDYSPEIGRWTARDPLQFGGQQENVCLYVNGDPVNGRDPSGLVNWGPLGGRCFPRPRAFRETPRRAILMAGTMGWSSEASPNFLRSRVRRRTASLSSIM